MTAGVEAERAGLAGEFHAGLLGCPAAFAVVAVVTAGHKIFPGRFAGA